MSIEIENIFKARAQSTCAFLNTGGQGCYIPAYQRPYSWDQDNVERLFEDAIHGMALLLKRRTTITFLGTIIAIHDTKYRTVQPLFKAEVAPRVMSIIDGQQRICTFAMTNMVFHDQIRRLARRFSKAKDAHFVWLFEQAQQLLPAVKDTFVLDMHTGEGNYRYYPRVIRAYADAWSRRKSQANYTSPVAQLIWEYFEYQENEETKAFRYDPKNSSGNPLESHQTVVKIFQIVQRKLGQVTGSKAGDADFPDILGIIQSDPFIDAIWGFDLPDEVKTYITDETQDRLYEPYCQLFRLIVFAKYMNDRMAFTVVTTESEDDAFDMFEALNTTGEPLTAYETFKPKVIEAESLDKFEQSPSIDSIRQIEEYLERFRKAEEKQKATSEMLVPFALAETGDKIQKRLNDQRRYLRDEYEKLPDIDEKREFVRRVSSIAQFMQHGWDIEKGKTPTFHPLDVEDADAIVGFEALRDLNHHITIAPLSRFFGRALEATGDSERAKRTAEFVEAIKATVAFSMLWRGAFGGTENIDSHYRDIMRQGIEAKKVPPLAKRPKLGTGAVSIANYKKALRHYLQDKGKLKTKEDWVKAAGRTPIYDRSRAVARFLVFSASDDAIADDVSPGLIKRGRRGIASMMTADRWHDGDYYTVEHVAPQTPATGWESEIYKDRDVVHCLGNLILLPAEENSVLGSRPWPHKRLMYRLLSASDETVFGSAKAECQKNGLTLSKKTDEVLSKSGYLGMCKSLAERPDNWDKAFIAARSQRIAELAWDRIAPWLDLS